MTETFPVTVKNEFMEVSEIWTVPVIVKEMKSNCKWK